MRTLIKEMKKQGMLEELASIRKRERGIVDVQVRDSLEKLIEVENASYSQKLMILESIQRNTKQALEVLHNL